MVFAILNNCYLIRAVALMVFHSKMSIFIRMLFEKIGTRDTVKLAQCKVDQLLLSYEKESFTSAPGM